MYPSVIVGLLLDRGYIKLSQSNGKKPDSKKTVSSVVSDCSPKFAKICLISITLTLPLSPFKSNTYINGENMHVWVNKKHPNYSSSSDLPHWLWPRKSFRWIISTDRFSCYLGSRKTIQNFTTLTVCVSASVNIRGCKPHKL